MSSLIISVIRYCVITVGIAVAYYLYFHWSDARPAIEIILLTCVAFNGIISFVSHVIYHKSDARRLGLESANPGFQFEVGFANLAMGLGALLSLVFHWGVAANIAIILCYALYLLQAIILHLYRFIKREKSDAGYLWGSVVFAFLYVANMLFFAAAGLAQEHLAPF
ncbi:MAG: hypothetical protein NTY79_00735 [Chloroflexi bacterium]|nr:hypothetical protein [Chloroflexota bacterium]